MTIITTHNTLFALRKRGVLEDLKNTPGHIRGLQEVSDTNNQAAVEEFCREFGYGNTGTYPVPIIWNRNMFAPVSKSQQVLIAPPVDHTLDPARYATIARFVNLKTEKTISVINAHGHKFTNPKLDNMERRLQLVEQQFLNLTAWVAKEMARWDSVHLIGDLNVEPVDNKEWFYPCNLFAPLLNVVTPIRSIDWITNSVNSKMRFIEIESEMNANTDHAIKWAKYRLA